MPKIIDYSTVVQRMTSTGLRCNYPSSGAFGFPPSAQPIIRGWIGPADSTIRPSLLPVIKSVPPPYEANLAQAAMQFWQTTLPGPAWIMPLSHWHFELRDGSRDYLPGVLTAIGIDPKLLEQRADGSAIEFAPDEAAPCKHLMVALLENLRVSDFLLAFPGHPITCTLHHHKQLWWTTSDPALIDAMERD